MSRPLEVVPAALDLDESERRALAKRMTDAFEKSGKTRAQLQRETGVNRWQTVDDWLSGNFAPSVQNLIRFARATRVTLNDLLALPAQEPESEAWISFLSTREARSMTVEERSMLAIYPWEWFGLEATVTAYLLQLDAVRSARRLPLSS